MAQTAEKPLVDTSEGFLHRVSGAGRGGKIFWRPERNITMCGCGNNGGCFWIIIILLLLFCCGGWGWGGFNGCGEGNGCGCGC